MKGGFKLLIMVLVILLVLTFGFEAILAYKFGWKTTEYITSHLLTRKTDIFEKEKMPPDTLTLEERFRVPGLLLTTKGNDIWLLTIYGIQHFTPIDAKNIFFLGKNICQYQSAIKSNLTKSGSNTFSVQELAYKNIQDWLGDSKLKFS